MSGFWGRPSLELGIPWVRSTDRQALEKCQNPRASGAFTVPATAPARSGTGTTTQKDTTVTTGNTYAYQVVAINLGGSSAVSNTATRAM